MTENRSNFDKNALCCTHVLNLIFALESLCIFTSGSDFSYKLHILLKRNRSHHILNNTYSLHFINIDNFKIIIW